MALSAMARARVALTDRPGPAIRRIFSSGSRSFIGRMRPSAGSVRPPGKTNLPGMKAWWRARRPRSTCGTPSRQSSRISVAESTGRRGPAPMAPSSASTPSISLRVIPIRSEADLAFMFRQLRVILQPVRLAPETVHLQSPLQPDDATFHWRQHGERGEDGDRDPDCQMLPHRHVEQGLEAHEGGDDNMADHEDDEIGGQVVGAVVVKFLT